MRLLLHSLVCNLVLFATAIGQANEVLPPPNILWITCEDISPNLGAYGDAYANTPNLDQLATEGILYKNAFASAPVCAVARSSIITGMYATSQGTHHMRCKAKRPKAIKMYPELLQKAGYYCSNNSKTDYNFDMDATSIWDDCSKQAHWRNRPDKEQAFFSIFNLITSHESRVNRTDRYQEAIKELKAEQIRKPGEVPLPPFYPDTKEVRQLWARYYSIITAMDQEVGNILQQLEEDGLAENTIVFFYSDHGAGLPRYKRWLYDSGLKVPLIVRVPEKYKQYSKAQAGSQIDQLVSFIDLAPTALHLAGLPIPQYMPGIPFLTPRRTKERQYVYASRDRMDERYDMQRAVRDKRFKYIRYYEPYKAACQYMNTPESGAIMKAIRTADQEGTLPEAGQHIMASERPIEALFDCEKDPYELTNLANDPNYTSKLEELRTAHAAWSDSTKDTGLIPETILRKWEKEQNRSIYAIMRTGGVPLAEIRQTALVQMDIRALEKQLRHKNEAIRYWAAINIGNQKTEPQNLAMLQKALADDIPIVRIAVARALCKFNQIAVALPVLQTSLQHKDQWVRLQAALVLDELGEEARPAKTTLQGGLNDSNKYVVRVVNHALNTLLGRKNKVR